MPNPVVHFEVLGKDAAALQAFYKAAFDWPMHPVMDGYSTAMPGGTRGIDGGIGKSIPGAPGHVTFYIEVANIAASLAQIETLGGTRLTDPMSVPNGPTIALFTDPEGHIIGLVQAGTLQT